MKQVERVRPLGVIDERDGQVARQRLAQKTVECVVQSGRLVLTCPRHEQRDIARKIGD